MKTQALIFGMDNIISMSSHAKAWEAFAGMREVAVCNAHTPVQLAGPRVMAAIHNYNELLKSNFLGNLHVANA